MHKLLFTIIAIFCTLNTYARDLSDIYEKVNPAVVVIFSSSKDITSDDGKTRRVNSTGLGSGFMISHKRLITAHHVVTVAEKVNIKFLDGEVIPAKVVSSFKSADVALLEFIRPKKDVVTVQLSDSDQVKIGEQ